jgi:hypothetical protein
MGYSITRGRRSALSRQPRNTRTANSRSLARARRRAGKRRRRSEPTPSRLRRRGSRSQPKGWPWSALVEPTGQRAAFIRHLLGAQQVTGAPTCRDWDDTTAMTVPRWHASRDRRGLIAASIMRRRSPSLTAVAAWSLAVVDERRGIAGRPRSDAFRQFAGLSTAIGTKRTSVAQRTDAGRGPGPKLWRVGGRCRSARAEQGRRPCRAPDRSQPAGTGSTEGAVGQRRGRRKVHPGI